MNTSILLFRCGVILAFTAFLTPLGAQSGAFLSAGNTEVNGFLGTSFGIDKARVMGGGNISYAVSKHLLPYAEFSYFPGIGRRQEGTFPGTGRPYTATYQIPLVDFHGGVHVRLPIRESRVVPYGVIGAGVIHSLARTVDATYDLGGSTVSQTLSAPARSDFAVNFGGGLRFYATQRFGFRLEAKAYKPTGTFSQVFAKFEGGVFFQIR